MDLKWINNDLVFFDGDITVLDDSILQELSLRIDTMKNEHWLVKTYGCNLKLRLGELNNTITQMLATDDLEDALDQDNRILENSVFVEWKMSSVLECEVIISDASITIGG